MNRTDLQKLAMCRLEEAEVLLSAGQFPGAYYLAGYAVECALKACIAKQTEQFEFPDKKRAERSWTHSIESLVTTAKLIEQRDIACQADNELAIFWARVKDWNEGSRYELSDEVAAHELFDAVSDANKGVLSWVKQYW